MKLAPALGDPTPSLGAWGTRFDRDQVPHIVPKFGPRHRLSLYCWCHPVVDEDYTEPAVSHNVAQ